MIDPILREIATHRQLEYLEAIEKYGSQRKAAEALKVARNAVTDAVAKVKKKAALRGYAPEYDLHHPTAPGQILRGASTLYKDGKPVIQWVKTAADEEQRIAIVKEIIKSMTEEIRGLSPVIAAPCWNAADYLAVYPIGDPHVGLHVWAKECGEAFDLKIARELTLGAVDRLMESAPSADTGIILLLGDVFHMNDQSNQTPAHKHQLDVDSRFVKVLQVGIEMYRHAILRALTKHKRVIVRCMQGNHDPEAIWALAFTLSAYFDNEPRVDVDLSPSPHWYYRFGKVLIGSTHGDKMKHEQLPAVMACDRAEDWGQTKHRYWYTGHVHSQNLREFPGVICESFRTLAAKDSYANGYGYRAGRDMVCIIHHKEHGEIERHRCDVGMLEAATQN